MIDISHIATDAVCMPQPDRREQLLSHLQVTGRASVSELAVDLGVTPATIRRDLQQLAVEGRLLRTYGGATIADRRSVRGTRAVDAKRAIAAAAASLVSDGATIALGSGTTVLELARRLVDRRLTVITNALDVANVLVDRAGIELIILGGVVRPRMHSMLGHLAEMATSELRADRLFMGIGAISLGGGLMNDSVPEIQTDRALRRMSRSVTVLADATKFDLVAPAYVFGLDEVDVIVTDPGLDTARIHELEQRGIRVILAPLAPLDAAPALAAPTGTGAARATAAVGEPSEAAR
jgi:DeoR/GlpR family transcriptional regulator of sugar metabolism